MKKFLIVLKFELNGYLKNKSFMLTSAILLIAAVAAVVFLPFFFNGNREKAYDVQGDQVIALVDENSGFSGLKDIQKAYPAKWEIMDTSDELKEAVLLGKADAGLILSAGQKVSYVVKNKEMYDQTLSQLEEVFSKALREAYLQEKGMIVEDISYAESIQVSMDTVILGKDSQRNYAYTYVLVFGLYMLILFYGQMISVAVATEKSNRAIEILVTSVDTNSLIFGKVLAGAFAGILQMGIFLAGILGAYALRREAWDGMLDFLFHVPGRVLLAYALFGILGYLLYSMLYGMLGALVSKTEDISKSASFVTFLYVAAFLAAIIGMNDSDGILVRVTSFIPFFSHNSMFIRIAMGSVTWWEVAVSALLQVAACIVAGNLVARIFRMGTLMYGTPVKFTKVLKMLKEK